MGATEFLVGPLSLALSLVALMGGLGLPVVTLLIRLVDYRSDQGEFIKCHHDLVLNSN